MSNQMEAMLRQIISKRDRGEKLLPLERILMVLNLQTPDRIPTGCFFTDWIANYYGYTCRQVSDHPDLHVDAIMRFYDEFGMDFVCEGIDTMNTEIEALGMVRLKHPENKQADIVERFFNGEEDIPKLEKAVERFHPEKDGRCPQRLELYRLLVEQSAPKGLPVIAAPSAVFAQAIQIIGYKRAVQWMRQKPHLMHRVMEIMVEAEIKWFKAIAATGVHGFISIDAWNSVPNFRAEQLYEFEKPYVTRVFASVAPMPVIHFYWGLRLLPDRWVEFLEKSAATGACLITDLEPDACTPPSNDLKTFKATAQRLKKMYLVGLKDELIFSGTPTQIRERVKHYIKELYPCENGCMIVPNAIPFGSPAENVRAFMDTIIEFGTYPIDLDKLS